MISKWQKFISQPGNIRVVSIEATGLMHELIQQQKLTGQAQVGYAEAIVGALLVASAHKSNESINLNAQGSTAYKQAMVDASPEGRVRGFLIEEKDPSMFTYGASGTNGPWGSGVLSVLYTKNFEGKYPYKGMVAISTGYLDEAFNEYYRDSEQVTSRLGLDVRMDGGKIVSARGALVQALGGASVEELADINALDVKQMRTLAAAPEFQSEASLLLKGRSFEMIEEQPLTSFCNCSAERIERALLLSGKSDVMDALGKDDHLEVTCDFCRTEYRITRERLQSVFSRDPSHLQ